MRIAGERAFSKRLPSELTEILRAVRRRYHATRHKPSLTDPRSYVGLLHYPEPLTLARFGYWPLPAEALAWIAESPRGRRQRRVRFQRRVELALAEILPEQAAAIRALLFHQNNGVLK